MKPRALALILGFSYVGLAVLGLLPGTARAGLLLDLFPVNLLLTFVHLAIGFWGVAAYAGWAHPGIYARRAAFLFAAFALMGMVDGADRMFGLMPLYGANVWLHLFSAALAGFVGWQPETGERRGLVGDRRRIPHVPVLERRRGVDRRREISIATA